MTRCSSSKRPTRHSIASTTSRRSLVCCALLIACVFFFVAFAGNRLPTTAEIFISLPRDATTTHCVLFLQPMSGDDLFDNSTCEQCAEKYDELNSFYHDLENKYSHGTCMDIVDMVSRLLSSQKSFVCQKDEKNTGWIT